MDGFNLFKRTLEISENKEVTHFFFGNKEEVVKKMTVDQIKQAEDMIDDYRVWLYPFR